MKPRKWTEEQLKLAAKTGSIWLWNARAVFEKKELLKYLQV